MSNKPATEPIDLTAIDRESKYKIFSPTGDNVMLGPAPNNQP